MALQYQMKISGLSAISHWQLFREKGQLMQPSIILARVIIEELCTVITKRFTLLIGTHLQSKEVSGIRIASIQSDF